MLIGFIVGNMKLEVYDRDNKLVCKLDDNNVFFGFYFIDDGMIIYVSFCFFMLCILIVIWISDDFEEEKDNKFCYGIFFKC